MGYREHKLISRRDLMAGGAALLAASVMPKVPARAQPTPTYTRYNAASPEGQQMLGSYQAAIQAMLQLPAEDARNWYRLAFQHYLDCPHGNWWLFPWHRGFTGWAEQIVRRFSGNESFAFPYWDWTANPQVPAAMSQGLLNPANPAFIQDIDSFASRFKPALAASSYWQAGSAQLQQLQIRDIGSNVILWDQLTDPDNSSWPSFFPAHGAGQTFPDVRNPDADLDCVTAKAVSSATLAAAMAAQDYMTFSSPEAEHHSQVVGFAVLEGQPHNKVHNNTGGIVYQTQGGQCTSNFTNSGGFMQAFLSPVDPLFYLHHSNIDRLWDAWTQEQIAAGRTTYLPPRGPAYDQWAREPFLFFVDVNGNPVTQMEAGDYASIGAFNYDYQPGGSVGAPTTAAAALRARERPPVRRFAAEVPPVTDVQQLTTGSVGATAIRLRPDLLRLARQDSPQRLLAKVTLALPHHERGQIFRVLVHTGDPAASTEIGTVSLFGHHSAHGLLAFTLPLDDALPVLRAAQGGDGFLHFRAVAPAAGQHHAQVAAMRPEREIRVHSVLVEAH